MGEPSSLEKKYQQISHILGKQATFNIDEVQAIFPNITKSSLYWNMSKLVDAGYLQRIRNGLYAVNEWKGKQVIALSETAERIQKLLDETGFEYFISGLDILRKYMQHVPEQYPIILFTEKAAKEEVSNILRANSFEISAPTRTKEMQERYALTHQNNDWVILYQTDSFKFSENSLATTEKAFVDLYYAVTRNEYPVALQELARIYANLTRLGNIDKKKMITVATKRNIQYDIRLIAESKFITEDAIRFVEILRKEE